MQELTGEASFDSWRRLARGLLSAGIPPDRIRWAEAGEPPALHAFVDGAVEPMARAGGPSPVVSRRFLSMAERAARHRDADRWALLYRVLWRLVHENRRLLELTSEEDVRDLELMADAVRRGSHPSGAPVRRPEPRREPPPPGLAAGERQAPAPRSPAGAADSPLFSAAGRSSAAAYVPETHDLDELRQAASRCEGCTLYRDATQVVFGEGSTAARVVLVGEQPGDQEDLAGAPFVGPAGEVLDRALAEAGIPREQVYVTNAVKHFKWEPRGPRRIHKKPDLAELEACRPWLDAELAAIQPAFVVCLGATAAQSLLGPQFTIIRNRGRIFRTASAPAVIATFHPSAVLRAADETAAATTYRALVEDLRKAAPYLARPVSGAR